MNYRKAVLRTLEARPQFRNLTYAALNLAGEAGEAVDLLKKEICKDPRFKTLDREHLIEELGDILWTVELLCILLDIDVETIQRANIHKLNNRFGIT